MQKQHVGKAKSHTAREAALRFAPGAQIKVLVVAVVVLVVPMGVVLVVVLEVAVVLHALSFPPVSLLPKTKFLCLYHIYQAHQFYDFFFYNFIA